MATTLQSKIQFFFQTPVRLQRRTGLKKFLEGLFIKEKKSLQGLNYVFCNDSQLLEINRNYLKHDDYTDIITFELSPKGQPIEGEVYISIDRVKENARDFNETVNKELHRVIFHGALHLCGYTDKTKDQKKIMRQMEDFYLEEYFK